MGTPPDNWQNCNDGKSTADTQPGAYSNTLLPSSGQTYISLVTRAVTSLAGTFETVKANLISPFKRNVCYNMSIDLSLSSTFQASTLDGIYQFNTPCILEIYATNKDCNDTTDRELIFRSSPINHFDWKEYLFSFTPLNNDYSFITLNANFANPSQWYNSALMIDNLKYPPPSKGFQGNGLTSHIPNNSNNIEWYFNGNLQNDTTNYLPPKGSGLYEVKYIDELGCFQIISRNIDYNIESLIIKPNPNNGLFELSYISTLSQSINVLEIFDVRGRLIDRFNLFTNQIGYNSIKFDISSYNDGVYFLRILRSDFKPITAKLVKTD
jgi:hypothetical protein